MNRSAAAIEAGEVPETRPKNPIDDLGHLLELPADETLRAAERTSFTDISEVRWARWLLGDTDIAPTEASQRAPMPMDERWSSITPAGALDRISALRKLLSFGYARRLAEATFRRFENIDPKTRETLADRLVTCTYMDTELPPRVALRRARKLLDSHVFEQAHVRPVSANSHALAGAIEKRWWEVDGDVAHLHRALSHYTNGYGGDLLADDGYQAVNAMFLLDLVSFVEEGGIAALYPVGKTPLPVPSQHRAAADALRRSALAQVDENDVLDRTKMPSRWLVSSLAEMRFGLGDDTKAIELLERLFELGPDEFELRSTARQLGQLLRIRRTNSGMGPGDQIFEFLESVSVPFARAVRSSFVGKVGIALSGGGFRASLYHVGVLARLAEHDLLRYVEVLSCVSGGSIVGAHYYLELRKLLQSKPDSEISRDDYLRIVRRMETKFLEGVQTDLRNTLLADASANWRAATDAGYSRTHRLGELFEERLFSRVEEGEHRPLYLNELFIEPALEATKAATPARPFNPRLGNWLRSAKVPILLLNATSMNTGHAWQFTPSWMGEPPGSYDPLLENMPRLRRMRLADEAPKPHDRVRLGHAVAASACVPGVFEPLVLQGLYDGIDVVLSDGGVHDNQGVASLSEQGCSIMIISDASGQMTLEARVGDDMLTVSKRANDVLMARVREAQLEAVRSRQRHGAVTEVVVAHLRMGLDTAPKSWHGSKRPPDEAVDERPRSWTAYGLPTMIQSRLASVRTDLDAFHDLEAYALMESGYRAIAQQIPECLVRITSCAPGYRWSFRRCSELLQTSDVSSPIAAELALSGKQFGKVLSVWREAFDQIAGALLIVGGLCWLVSNRGGSVAVTLALSAVVLMLPLLVTFLASRRTVAGSMRKRPSLWARATGAGLATLLRGNFLRALDQGLPLYLKRGKDLSGP